VKKLEGNEIKKNDTVYLLGTSDSLNSTVWDKEDVDYWACFPVTSHEASKKHRLDAIFELHAIETWGLYEAAILNIKKEYPNSIIYMQREEPKIKNSVEYPLREVQDMVDNIYLRKYQTSTISYMIALAILKGYKKIVLYGISLSAEEEEYSMQRSCAEAWLNFGLGKGIKYEIGQPSAVMASGYLYGYEPHKDVMIKMLQLQEGVRNAQAELSKKLRGVEREVDKQDGGAQLMRIIVDMFNAGSMKDYMNEQ